MEGIKELVLRKAKEGIVVINTIEGLQEMSLDAIIKQPTDGLLYDLNRSPEVILTFINDQKWVNDFACMLVIKKLKSMIDIPTIHLDGTREEAKRV